MLAAIQQHLSEVNFMKRNEDLIDLGVATVETQGVLETGEAVGGNIEGLTEE